MKKWIWFLLCASLILIFFLSHYNARQVEFYKKSFLEQQIKLRDMENTIYPLIAITAETACDFKNGIKPADGKPTIGGKLIYKREPVTLESKISLLNGGIACNSGVGNVYYIRCYEWDYEGNDFNNQKLWYRPIKDVPLNIFSCIDELEINIPYWDKQLQNAKLGQKYYK